MKKHSFVKTLVGSTLALLFAVALPASPAQAQVKVILDTDMDLDVDDAGALAVLHALADNGEAEILGVVCDAPAQRNGQTRLGAATISAINTYYGRGGIPIGDLPVAEYVNNPSNYHRYRSYADSFADPNEFVTPDDPPSTQYTYYNQYIKAHFPNANIASVYNGTTLYRKLLASAPDNSVVIINVGLVRVLRDLMYTGPDGYSSLTGKQLIDKKVKRLVAMTGGWFNTGAWSQSNDFNWSFEGRGDAVDITSEWPTEIVTMPFGSSVNTGARLSTETPASNPVRSAYEVFMDRKGTTNRSSWDQIAVIGAVRESDPDGIFIRRTGRNLQTRWISSQYPGGNPLGKLWAAPTSGDILDVMLDQRMSDGLLEDLVEDLMVQAPKPKYAGWWEAESANLSGPSVATTQPGYSGTGFADYNNTTGDYIEWRVWNPASSSRTYRFNFVYANGGADRPLKLSLNGTQVGSNLPFGDTGGWSNWQPQAASVTLAAGANTLRLTVTGVHGPNVDYLSYEMLQSGTYQAEDAFLSGTNVSQHHPGFSASGYVNTVGNTTEYIEWTVDKEIASSAKLVFRYANGYSNNRPMKLSVNGTVVSSGLAFNPTGSWTTWGLTNDIYANLRQGTNKIRLTGTGVNGDGPNVDYLWFNSQPSLDPSSSTTGAPLSGNTTPSANAS